MGRIKKHLFPIGMILMIIAMVAIGFVAISFVWDFSVLMKISWSIAALSAVTGLICIMIELIDNQEEKEIITLTLPPKKRI